MRKFFSAFIPSKPSLEDEIAARSAEVQAHLSKLEMVVHQSQPTVGSAVSGGEKAPEGSADNEAVEQKNGWGLEPKRNAVKRAPIYFSYDDPYFDSIKRGSWYERNYHDSSLTFYEVAAVNITMKFFPEWTHLALKLYREFQRDITVDLKTAIPGATEGAGKWNRLRRLWAWGLDLDVMHASYRYDNMIWNKLNSIKLLPVYVKYTGSFNLDDLQHIDIRSGGLHTYLMEQGCDRMEEELVKGFPEEIQVSYKSLLRVEKNYPGAINPDIIAEARETHEIKSPEFWPEFRKHLPKKQSYFNKVNERLMRALKDPHVTDNYKSKYYRIENFTNKAWNEMGHVPPDCYKARLPGAKEEVFIFKGSINTCDKWGTYADFERDWDCATITEVVEKDEYVQLRGAQWWNYSDKAKYYPTYAEVLNKGMLRTKDDEIDADTLLTGMLAASGCDWKPFRCTDLQKSRPKTMERWVWLKDNIERNKRRAALRRENGCPEGDKEAAEWATDKYNKKRRGQKEHLMKTLAYCNPIRTANTFSVLANFDSHDALPDVSVNLREKSTSFGVARKVNKVKRKGKSSTPITATPEWVKFQQSFREKTNKHYTHAFAIVINEPATWHNYALTGGFEHLMDAKIKNRNYVHLHHFIANMTGLISINSFFHLVPKEQYVKAWLVKQAYSLLKKEKGYIKTIIDSRITTHAIKGVDYSGVHNPLRLRELLSNIENTDSTTVSLRQPWRNLLGN